MITPKTPSQFKMRLLRGVARLKTFRRKEDGATVVEFALLALPFFIMLLGIIELAIIFFLGSSLQNATHEASRLIRTGDFDGSYKEFENEICSRINPGKTTDAALKPCRDKLEFSVVSLSDFSEVAFGAATPTPAAPAPASEDDAVPRTSGGETVMVRVSYTYQLVTPGEWTHLSNVDGENKRAIISISAFRNEPF